MFVLHMYYVTHVYIYRYIYMHSRESWCMKSCIEAVVCLLCGGVFPGVWCLLLHVSVKIFYSFCKQCSINWGGGPTSIYTDWGGSPTSIHLLRRWSDLYIYYLRLVVALHTWMKRICLDCLAAGLQKGQQKQVSQVIRSCMCVGCSFLKCGKTEPSVKNQQKLLFRTCLRAMAENCRDDFARSVRQHYIRLLAAEGLSQAHWCLKCVWFWNNGWKHF